MTTNQFASAIAGAVLAACKRQVDKNRSLDNLNLDAITSGALASLEVEPWDRDDIQFPRLLAEISATQDNLDLQALADSMELSLSEVASLFDRADQAWETIKATGKLTYNQYEVEYATRNGTPTKTTVEAGTEIEARKSGSRDSGIDTVSISSKDKLRTGPVFDNAPLPFGVLWVTLSDLEDRLARHLLPQPVGAVMTYRGIGWALANTDEGIALVSGNYVGGELEDGRSRFDIGLDWVDVEAADLEGQIELLGEALNLLEAGRTLLAGNMECGKSSDADL